MKNLLMLMTFLLCLLSCPKPANASIDGAKYPLYAIQTIYSSTNVGSSYVTLVAATSQKVNSIQVTDSGGQTMQLGFGTDCSHVTSTLIIAKNSTGVYYPVGFPAHYAICLKSLGSTASTGENDLNVYY